MRVCRSVLAMAGCLLLCGGPLGCSDDDDDKPLTQPAAPHSAPAVNKPTDATPANGGTPSSGAAIEGPIKPPGPARAGTLWVTGTVNNLGGRRRVAREGDAEVCVFEHGDLPCVKTRGQSGAFAIEVPKLAEVALLLRGDKLIPTLRAFVTGDQDMDIGNSRVANELGLSAIAQAQGKPFDEKLGGLFFGGVEGVSARLEPASGELFFIDMAGGIVPGAKTVPMHGSGGFYNVQPGVVRVHFSLEGGHCRYRRENTFSGWPDPERPDVARVPVRPGHHTHLVSMFCERDTPASATAPTAPAAKKAP